LERGGGVEYEEKNCVCKNTKNDYFSNSGWGQISTLPPPPNDVLGEKA